MKDDMQLRVGDFVEVKSKEEILRTLDGRGCIDGMPFMPEMFQFCGRRFRVGKRAHKTCDTITGEYRGRCLKDSVHLEGARCDGAAHGGCQAGCLLFWKTSWLKRVDGHIGTGGPHETISPEAGHCTEEAVLAATRSAQLVEGAEAYACQATELLNATKPLSSWNPRQYVEDITSGNIRVRTLFNGLIYMCWHKLANAGIGLGKLLRWTYDASAKLRGGFPYPRRIGPIRKGDKTPACDTQFEVGDWVRVRPYQEILRTLDQINRNRGLAFDAELVPFCGGTYRVLKKVTRIVDERNGRMLSFKTPCYILEGVVCEARYSECRLFCPRALYSFWREIWLEKAEAPNAKSFVGGHPTAESVLS